VAHDKLKPLAPIRDLHQCPTSSAKLAAVIQDVFLCYKWIHERCKVLHCDVSVNNLMYREEGRMISGALIDYDLAVDVNRIPGGSTGSKQRTGTKSFMAIGLLYDPPALHAFKHDLESLFYCYLWMVVEDTTYRDEERNVLLHPSMTEWGVVSMSNSAQLKNLLIFQQQIPPPLAQFKAHLPICQVLQGVLRKTLPMEITSAADGSDLAKDPYLKLSGATAVLEFEDFEHRFCGITINKLTQGLVNAPCDRAL